MKTPTLFLAGTALALATPGQGLVVDNFAGGGGASTGIEQALKRAVDIAINHDAEAIAMHTINHPETRHIQNNIWRVDPKEVTKGQHVKLAWFSPDCTHHSKARGGKPRQKSIRDLSWVVILWAEQVKPDCIFMENVEEIQSWGPLGDDGLPIKERAGETWTKWLTALRRAGYKVQFKELRACDYGAPTIRKRLFLIARCDGKRIKWPKPTHGKPGSRGVLSGKLLPYRTAADSVIDFTIDCPSIFTRKKALADNTLRRIAHGIMKFVVNCDDPFIIPVKTWGGGGNGPRSIHEPARTTGCSKGGEFAIVNAHITKFRTGAIGHRADEPLATVTANSYVKRPGGAPPLGLVGATLINTRNGEREGQAPRARDVQEPAPTVTAIGSQGGVAQATLEKLEQHLTTAHVVQHSETRPGRKPNAGHDAREPVSTIVQKGPLQGLATSNIVKLKGTCRHGQPSDEPLHTVATSGGTGGGHFAEVEADLEALPLSEESLIGAQRVYAFLLKYYGTDQDPRLLEPLHVVTTKDRFALVTVTIDGEQYAIVDIGMRMLTPRELFNAQGFPPDYVIDFDFNGKPLTKSAQIAKCGNSVCPPMSRALVAANFEEDEAGFGTERIAA